MHGSLALRFGVVWIARHARVARVVPFDLDGAQLGEGFAFSGSSGRRASADAIAVDDDRRLWVADRAGARVRGFSAFGREFGDLLGVGSPQADPSDRGEPFEPCAVAVDGVELDARILVGSASTSPRSLALFDRGGERRASLRSRGDPERPYLGIAAVALRGRFAWVCERGAALVQVFRDTDFHFAFRLPVASGTPRAPSAVAPLSDGRCVVAGGAGDASGVWLVDRDGRARACVADAGTESGRVIDPLALAIEDAGDDRRTRIVVLDSDADRAQVFTLDGVCYGSFPGLPRT